MKKTKEQIEQEIKSRLQMKAKTSLLKYDRSKNLLGGKDAARDISTPGRKDEGWER